MQRDNIKGSVILLLAAFIWGLAFVVQNDASGKISPFAFNSLRSFLGAFVIGVYLLIKKTKFKKKIFADTADKKNVILGSVLCGFFLFLLTNFQQSGITVYPKGCAAEARAGFITALYVIMVPVISVILKRKISFAVWIAVGISVVGIYLLCLSGGLSGVYLGDILMFFCALSCAFHIMFVDKYGVLVGVVVLSCLQFLVNGILSGVCSLIFETVTLTNVYNALPQILYMGILSSGLAYTLQVVGQKYAQPAIASISMSFESVFAAIGGWLITGNALSVREFFGCLLLFVAITVAQLPEFYNKKTRIKKT